MRGFATNLRPPPCQAHQVEPSRLAPSTPPGRPQQQAGAASFRVKERPGVGDKRQRSADGPASENRHAVEPSGLMAATRSTAWEEESLQRRRREAVDSSKRQASPIAVDADLASTIELLPSHLQPMVTLLARKVSPSVEGKMMEKIRKDAFNQAANMMVAVSYSSSVHFFFQSVVSSLFTFLFVQRRALWRWPGLTKIA